MTTDGRGRPQKRFSWRERGRSFRYAGAGLKSLLISEHNARIHSVAAVVAILLGIFLRISAVEWCFIVACIGSVIAMEAVNTAVEALADRITTEQSPLIKTAKDVAAGAVLITAVAAFIIGCIIFIPKLLALT